MASPGCMKRLENTMEVKEYGCFGEESADIGLGGIAAIRPKNEYIATFYCLAFIYRAILESDSDFRVDNRAG